MRFKIRLIGKVVLALAAVAILGYVVMALWNAIVPGVFTGVHSVDYREALGLLILCRILFGGFRGRGGFSRRHWQRLETLSPEERARFLGKGCAERGS